MRLITFTLVALVLGALAGGTLEAAWAQRVWVEVRSPRFLVVADTRDRTARDVAWQFEQVRTALKAA